MIRELRLDEAFTSAIRTYQGLLPTSKDQLERIVTKKDDEIEMLKLKVA